MGYEIEINSQGALVVGRTITVTGMVINGTDGSSVLGKENYSLSFDVAQIHEKMISENMTKDEAIEYAIINALYILEKSDRPELFPPVPDLPTAFSGISNKRFVGDPDKKRKGVPPSNFPLPDIGP